MQFLINEEVYDTVIEKGLRQARHSVWIATANIKNLLMAISDTHVGSSVEFFEQLASRRIYVRLLHSGVPSAPFLKALGERETELAGSPYFQMKRCIRVHFKCVLIDNRSLYVGSANFTGAGLGMKGKTRRNFEVGVMTEDDRIMDRVAGLYEDIWNGRLCPRCGRKQQCVVPLESPF
jgi:phosphatidylserine/phosphatidylglycerophosphate/cardiolipin synthase-like enzyme